MNSFNENKIDKQTETKLQNNKNILKSTDDIVEVNGNSFYGDLSNLSNLPENIFMKKLAEECNKAEGYSNKIIYISVNSWAAENKQSPIHMIVRFIRSKPDKFKEAFSGVSFIFINTQTGENFGLIVDKYEESQFNTVLGLLDRVTKNTQYKAVTGDKSTKKTPEKQVVDKKAVEKKKAENNKKELVKAVAKATEDAADEDPEIATEKVMSDEEVLAILAQVEADENPSINKTRAARMSKVNKEFLDSTVGKTTVRNLIQDTNKDIEPAHLEVSTINKEEWDNLKFANFEKSYDINKDIYSMLYSLANENKSYPVSIRKVTVEDTSTSMDYILTYRAECEDSFGNRFTIKFDIPKFINNRFMMLRGNEKAMSGQLMLLPCLKTDADTVQLVSNYNKIFVRRYGMVGKSYPDTDRLIKSLNKYKGNKIKVVAGDNSLICTKYDLPIDYIDIASNFSTIETNERIYYFDQDIYFKKYNADLIRGIPYAINKSNSEVLYYTDDEDIIFSTKILNEISGIDDELDSLIKTTKPAERLSYSQSSILAHKIPLVVMLGYHIGLESLLKRAKIEYRFGKDRPDVDETSIKFADANLIYKVTYESSLLLNGLSECDTRNYTIADMDKRATWLDFLDDFGGRILSDGLDNFKDLFMDPITIEVCKDCRLPIDYIDLLIYANNLLADNKYNRHTDISGNRYRTNEIVAAYFYIALGKAYEQYANSIRRGNKKATVSMKQTAVLDAILTSNISSDLSTLNPLLEITTASTATFKGPSGMNSDRAYGLDKRTYDDSMVNKLALSTGFSANVGIDRQTTIDMDVDGVRGYIKNTNEDDMSVTKTFSMSEAVTPFGVTRETI